MIPSYGNAFELEACCIFLVSGWGNNGRIIFHRASALL